MSDFKERLEIHSMSGYYYNGFFDFDAQILAIKYEILLLQCGFISLLIVLNIYTQIIYQWAHLALIDLFASNLSMEKHGDFIPCSSIYPPPSLRAIPPCVLPVAISHGGSLCPPPFLLPAFATGVPRPFLFPRAYYLLLSLLLL